MGSVKLLMEKEGGGAAWLQGLRQVPYLEASEALCSLPGVGPKVTMLPWPGPYICFKGTLPAWVVLDSYLVTH